jgi:hypothetical protein
MRLEDLDGKRAIYEDPWDAAEQALRGNQQAVYDLNTNTSVDTPLFMHDQIAKGCQRCQ